jgi:hypothetical protein
MTSAIDTAVDLVRSLAEQGFWGNLGLRFQHGQVVHITKEESIQPEPKNRRSYDQHSN